MKKLFFHFILLVISAGTILSGYFNNDWIIYIFKPLIMICISGYFLYYSKNIEKQIVRLSLGAFFFSWLGDVFLMFSDRTEVFFASGVFAFLIGQIFYIILFLKTISLSGKKPFLRKQPFWLIAYIAYGLLFAIILFNSLDTTLRIGIFIYIGAILSMSAMALNRMGNGHPFSFTMVFTGSLFFIASDSIIAIDRFLFEFEHAHAVILFTYILAQYLIMRGIIKQYE